MSLRAAVVGAGAVGTTAAFDLSFGGAEVVLFDRGDVAAESTGRAAGICYDAFADDLDAEIGHDSVERFRTFSEHGEFEFRECPYVWLAREGDDRRAAAIRGQVPRMQRNGTVVAELDPDALADRFPSIRADDVAVAAVAGAAGHTDPATYARLLAVLAKKQGATLRTDTAATVETDPLRVNDEPFDAVLVAAGAHTKSLLATAGFSLALKPYRVQALTTADAYDGPMVYDATEGFYLRPHPDGMLAGDGTEEREADPDGYDRDAADDFPATMRERIAHRVPGADAAVTDAWAGLCTATPDHDPLLGELEAGLYVATGFQGHGFMRSPALGERVAEQILGAGDGVPAFDPTRFTGDEEFEIVEGMAIE